MHDELVYMKDNQGTTTYMYMYTFIILSVHMCTWYVYVFLNARLYYVSLYSPWAINRLLDPHACSYTVHVGCNQ